MIQHRKDCSKYNNNQAKQAQQTNEKLTTPKHYLSALKNYYLTPLDRTFKSFRSGVIYFSVGLIFFYLANISIEPSAFQEVIILSSMLLAFIGFIMAMLAQTRMIISRLVRFFS